MNMPYSFIWIKNITYESLNLRVNVFYAFSSVGDRIVSHIVNVVFAKEIDGYDPRARHQYLINPFAVL